MAYLHPRDIKTKEYINKLMLEMPFYVHDFKIYKDRTFASPNTMLQYLYIYRHFFNWLMSEGYADVENIKDITLEHLDNLSLEIAECYIDEIRDGHKNKDKDKETPANYSTRSLRTVANVISGLKALFKYLSEKSELSGTRSTYIQNDVFAKIPIPIKKETSQSRAERISDVIIKGDQFSDLLDFMEFEYPLSLTTKQQQTMYNRDIKRDLLIISLFLTTGIRVGECASMMITDINLKKRTAKVTRKGDKLDTIFLMDSTVERLEDYLEIRDKYYKDASNCPYLFVTLYRGKANPITVKAIENLVKKYTSEFTGDKGISPHKLRHSFAVDYRNRGGDLEDLRDLMGHTTTDTTSLYLNNSNERKFNFLKEIDNTRRAALSKDIQ